MNDNQKLKRRVRESKRWKEFRSALKKERKYDELTGSKLLTRFQVHHCDLDINNYADLDKSKFVCLNMKSHECVHFLYEYYKKDREIINRLKAILDKMVELNED